MDSVAPQGEARGVALSGLTATASSVFLGASLSIGLNDANVHIVLAAFVYVLSLFLMFGGWWVARRALHAQATRLQAESAALQGQLRDLDRLSRELHTKVNRVLYDRDSTTT
ncbi:MULTISPECIES: hypothetical protein [unclassified Nocardioides]|uniref:hypothetical protein n=1 Tax=unclassified Nocardioides TaxID=2615069 RepID=UPI0030158006